jgi:hypothetical protein
LLRDSRDGIYTTTVKLDAQIGKLSITADAQHPNKMNFRGVLVRIDEASTKPPGGAQGHKIYIPADVARRRLNTLIGMGLNYSPDLDSHAQRRKVGVIEKAWIDGQDVCVSGFVWKHDFPEAEKDLKQPGLGMSMELVDVAVENPNAPIWTLKDFHFSGATILYRNAAAYYRTQAIAAKADQRSKPMAKATKKAPAKKPTTAEVIATIAAAAAAKVVAEVVGASNKSITVMLSRQTKSIGELAAAQTALTKRVAKIDTAAEENDGEESLELEADGETEVEAGKKPPAGQDDQDEEDQDDGGDDEDGEVEAAEDDDDIDVGDLEELETPDGDEKPGHKNEDATNKGSKTTSENKVGPHVTAKAFNALKAQVETLTKTLAASQKNEKKLASKLEAQEKQLTAASDRVSRRTLSPEAAGLLAKAHINASDLFATGQKLTVAELDAVLASFNAEQGNRMTITDRMMLKNQFTAAGLLEDGVVNRAAN